MPDDLRPEYDLASLGPGVRGKYAGRLNRTTLVALQPEVAQAFPTSEAVNEALRAVLGRRLSFGGLHQRVSEPATSAERGASSPASSTGLAKPQAMELGS